MQDEIWEFRTKFNKTYYRLFAFWDKTDDTDTIVISTHGLIKKTGKERNLTQEELGKLVGVKKAQISKIENSN